MITDNAVIKWKQKSIIHTLKISTTYDCISSFTDLFFNTHFGSYFYRLANDGSFIINIRKHAWNSHGVQYFDTLSPCYLFNKKKCLRKATMKKLNTFHACTCSLKICYHLTYKNRLVPDRFPCLNTRQCLRWKKKSLL